jgi:hypothetical protein
MKKKYALFLWTQLFSFSLASPPCIQMVYGVVSRGIPPLFGWEVSKIKLIGQSHSTDSPTPAFKQKQCNMIRKLEARLGVATLSVSSINSLH